MEGWIWCLGAVSLAMNYEPRLAALGTSLKVIGSPDNVRTGDAHYRELLSELLQRPRADLAADLAWLPAAVLRAYETSRGAKQEPLESVIYWNGEAVESRPWPNVAEVWSQDYRSFAECVIEVADQFPGCTIIDIGSGFGAISLYVNRERPNNFRFVNIDREAFALCAGAEFAQRHRMNMTSVWMDISSSLQTQNEMDLLAEIIGSGPSIVITRGALHPFYTNDQYRQLFDFLLHDVRVSAGVHLEINGFRTKTFNEVARVFNEPIPITPFWDTKSDPFEILLARNDTEIVDRVEIWPHYQGLHMSGLSHWPSYLSWRSYL